MAVSFGGRYQNINGLIQKTPSTSPAEVPSDPFGLIGLGAGSPNLVPSHGGYGNPLWRATSRGFTLMPQKGIQKNMKEIGICQMAVSKRHHEGVKIG